MGRCENTCCEIGHPGDRYVFPGVYFQVYFQVCISRYVSPGMYVQVCISRCVSAVAKIAVANIAVANIAVAKIAAPLRNLVL